MNKHERRVLRLREQSDAATAKADREAAFSHQPLFESLPTSLDDLLRDSFAERVSRPHFVVPSKFGYPHLIDERPVADAEHEFVCRTLLAQLKAIVEWCRDHQIDMRSLVHTEMESLTEFYRQHGVNTPNADLYRDPRCLFDIVEDLIDGDDDEAFTDLIQLGKTVPVEYTLQDIAPQIDDQLTEEQSCASGTQETTSSDNSHSASDSTTKEALLDNTLMTLYRTPTEWRELRKEAGLSSSERTWTKIRKKNAAEIQCETGNRGGPVRLTRRLAENWGLNLPEFKQKSDP